MSAAAPAIARGPAAVLPVGLVADDLTGALDAAAVFARPQAPVAILARADGCRGSFALDAGTRGASKAEAQAAAARDAPLLREVRTAFRKIDSLLRGHPAAEIAATARAGDFASVVVAPAFPAQGRITLQGRQYARHADGTYRLIDVDLGRALAACGLAPRPLPHIAAMAGAGVFLCDAEYDSDLAAIAAARPRLRAPVLWCGTSGLARALAGAVAPLPVPPGPCLGVVGSRHPLALAEIDRLQAADPDGVIVLAGGAEVAAAVARAGERLAGGRWALVTLRLPAADARAAARLLRELARAASALRPAVLFASGGDTLAALRDASGAARLDALGETAPGIPLSRLVGGGWDGVAVVSKSGAFAGGGVLARLFGGKQEDWRGPA